MTWSQYNDLLKKRQGLSGYYREKIDRNIESVSKKIIQDQTLCAQIKGQDPKIMHHIRQHAQHDHVRCVDV